MSRRALCLNATYEPLGFIPIDRAVVLCLEDRVRLLESSGKVLRSAGGLEVEEPEVVILKTYVRTPQYLREGITSRVLFARDDYTCQYCERHHSKLRKGNKLTIDHIKPKSQNGPHHWDNVVTACYVCNIKKRNRTPMQANMPLKGKYKHRSPKKPHLLVFTWGGRLTYKQLKWIKSYYGVESLNDEVNM